MISRTTISLAAVLVWVGCAHHILCDLPSVHIIPITSIGWHIRNFNMLHSWWKVFSARYSVSKSDGPKFVTRRSIRPWEPVHIHCHRGHTSSRTWESHQSVVIIHSIAIVVWMPNNFIGTNDCWSLSSHKNAITTKTSESNEYKGRNKLQRIPVKKLQSSYLPTVFVRIPSVRVMTNSPNFEAIETANAMSSCQNKLQTTKPCE